MYHRLAELPEDERQRLDKEHGWNMRLDVPFVRLPFFIWLGKQKPCENRFVEALRHYFGVQNLRGLLEEAEIANYRHQYEHWWWLKNYNEKRNTESRS
jgi:hypothetical protein